MSGKYLFHIVFCLLWSGLSFGQCGSGFQPLSLGNDTVICQGQQITLGTPNIYDSYLWNTGSRSSSITVLTSGTYSLTVQKLQGNVVQNGDFSGGNVGFQSDYIVGPGGTWGLLSDPGTFAVTSNSSLVHNNFSYCFDHTSGNSSGSMLVVNGSDVQNEVVWKQTVTISPNTDYQFSVWAASVVADNPGTLRFMINGVQVGAQLNLPWSTCNWQQFFVTWNSGVNTTAEIAIINQNTLDAGNDFALDDITFRPVCTSTDAINVTVEARPVVNLGPGQTICRGESVTFDAVQPNPATYQWNTGHVSSSIQTDTAGLYQVTVTSPNGCVASDNVNVAVEERPDAGSDAYVQFCNSSNQVDLVDHLASGIAQDGSWSTQDPMLNGNLSANGILNLSSVSGDFDVIYVKQGTFCPNDTSHWQLSIADQPVAGNDVSLHLCNSSDFNTSLFSLLDIVQPSQQGHWVVDPIVGGAFDIANDLLSPELTPEGNYTISYVLEAEGVCVNDTASLNLQISSVPVIQFSSDKTRGCEELTVSFVNETIASPNTTYSWQLSDGSQYTADNSFTHVFLVAGCYDVALTAVTDGLCVATGSVSNMICVDPLPVADFSYGPQQVYSDFPEVNFTNNSTLNYTNEWDFGDGQGDTQENPSHVYEQGVAADYTVTLVVVTDAGCSDTTTQVVEVREQLLFFVPNAFTPDEDKFNPVFRPVMTAGFDPNDYELTIYNRWGEIVFSSMNPSVGWDGNFGGNMCPDGLYLWTLKFGHEFKDNVFSYKGHVSLIR